MKPTSASGTHSLRRRLLVSVMAAILIGAVFQGVSAYRSALAQADTLFDYHLQQMANSLRGGPALPGLQLDSAPDKDAGYVIQIWSADGTHVFQSSRVVLPPRAVLGFTDVTHKGTRYRVFSVQTPLQTIQIAQNMDDRLSRARTLAARALLPMAIVAPLLMLVLWWLINRSLAPLERTRQQVAARAADDLTALPETGLPEEVQPLVQEINLLFGRLHDSFDAQRAFVANAAHELRSPLTALKLQAQSLARTSDPLAQQLAVTRLNQGVDRAIALMQQLLVLARQESAHPSTGTRRRIDIQALSEPIVRELQPLAQSKSVTLALQGNAPGWVEGDADGLSILLRNLLENAIKYTPGGGQIVLKVQAQEGQPTWTVEDSGPGIPDAQREHMFERFVRGEHPAATGSGLGLSIARAIALRHGARLTLGQSRDLGGLSAQVAFPPVPAQ
jgi:two-component system, OmpR family, sensor kinase